MYTEIISLDMHNQIEDIRKKNGGIASPFSFVSLYAWRDIVGERVYLEDNLYSMAYGDIRDNSWIFPCGGDLEKINFIRKCMEDKNLRFYYVRNEDKAFLDSNFPGQFEISPQEDFDEYIYSVNEQIELKGNRFHRIRNRINKLLKENTLYTRILCDDNLEDAIKVIEKWAEDKYEIGNLSTRGDEVDADALRNWKELGLSGVIVYSDLNPLAVAAGFYLSEDMYDILICKAYDRIPGLFYYTRRELLKTLSGECSRVDLEDDMGLEGLRTMKEELHPVGKIKMWKARSL